MKIIKNHGITGSAGRTMLLDIYAPSTNHPKATIVFIHGFKGFKDWGFWNNFAEKFVQNQYQFVSFNFSHNGMSSSDTLNFDELEAFGQNTFSKEKYDLTQVIDTILGNWCVNSHPIYLIGHSRGGGLGIIYYLSDPRIGGMVSWASVGGLDYMWNDKDELLAAWKSSGVHYVSNSRTKQQMPLYYQLYEDFIQHEDELNLNRVSKRNIRLKVIHGTNDPGVPMSHAYKIKELLPESQLCIINGANHVFGGSHPYLDNELNGHGLELFSETLRFFEELL